jgi:hypothetical protein
MAPTLSRNLTQLTITALCPPYAHHLHLIAKGGSRTGDRNNGFAKAVGVMENNQTCDPVNGLSVSACLPSDSYRPETQLQPSQFEAMLHEAWLILNSRKSPLEPSPGAD